MSDLLWNQNELNLQQRKAAIEQKLIETGEKERLLEYLRQKLVESGWKDELKNYCKGINKFRAYKKQRIRQDYSS